MLFTEDPAFYNGVPPADAGSVADVPATTPNGGNGSGPPHASKLNSWATTKRGNSKEGSGPPGGFNGSEDEKAWNNNRNTPQEQRVPWSDPDQMGTPGSLEGEFMTMGLGGNGGPPKGPPQWGRAEINQSTPWEHEQRAGGGFVPPEMPASGPRFMQPVSMDTGTNHWRSWDHDGGFQKDFHGGPGGFPPMGVPNKMPGQFYPGANNFVMQPNFNDRMMRNGPPHMAAQQQHPWMGDKFGGPQGGGGRFPQNQGFGGPPQAGPLMGPPQMGGHQRGFMPPPPLGGHPHGHSGPHHGSGPHGGPHPQHHHGGGPPPPMHPLAAAGPGKGGPNDMGGFVPSYGGVHGQGNFDVGTFKAPANMINDDAVWHDPNGYLRKWQRDTGTAAWGDPSKQSGQPIRRWQNVDENDPLSSGAVSVGSSSGGIPIAPIGSGSGANGSGSGPQQSSPDSLKKEEDEIAETGWGELPPLNGQSTSSGGPSGMMGGPQHGGPPNPALGPPPMGGHQPNQPVGSGAWMAGGPAGGPMNPQSSMNQGGVSGWADSQQRSLASNSFIPPGNPFPPNSHFYGGNPAAGGPPGEWARPPFGAAGAPFDVGPANGGGPPGSTNEIADKLRLAAAKGLINPVLFCNSGKLSTQTASLLNTMINLLTQVEQQDVRIDHMKRNGGVGTPEFERLVRETSDAKNQLSDLRDKIHASIDSRPKASLADELTDMNTMPIGSEGPLFLNF